MQAIESRAPGIHLGFEVPLGQSAAEENRFQGTGSALERRRSAGFGPLHEEVDEGRAGAGDEAPGEGLWRWT